MDSGRKTKSTISPDYEKMFDDILSTFQSFHSENFGESKSILLKAYRKAEFLHENQIRKSGEKYIIHPLEVSKILADFGMDLTTLVASLLHDTVEDTDYSITDLTKDFGEETAYLVDGVTKLDKLSFGLDSEAETLRKMIIATAKDPRVLVIKVADRLHNMRTIRFLSEEKQKQKALETLDVIAPLAHRLGMSKAKLELEDLAFGIIYPKQFKEILRLVELKTPFREKVLEEIIKETKELLKNAQIEASVYGRPKHYWSIYRKTTVKGKEFSDIFDLIGIRIICKNIKDTYAALGIMHSKWQPISGRFKDYIAQPKYGVYQSLHTSLFGPNGKPLEVQIRTQEMEETAEYGIAAHWRYKENPISNKKILKEIENIAWMRHLLEWQNEIDDSTEFIENLRTELSGNEIFVYSPLGTTYSLPKGSTPVDFAYYVHSDIGDKCIGAKVNNKIIALNSELKTGDTVEILTSKSAKQGPSKDWLSFVITGKAKTKIKQWFKKEKVEEYQEVGKELLKKELRRLRLPSYKILQKDNLLLISKTIGFKNSEEFLTALGENNEYLEKKKIELEKVIAETDLIENIQFEEISNIKKEPKLLISKNSLTGVEVEGSEGIPTKLAKCCMPVPNDKIVGFVTMRGIVTVHRSNCINIINEEKSEINRIVRVYWDNNREARFQIALEVEAMDRSNLLVDVSQIFSEYKINIHSVDLNVSSQNSVKGKFILELSDLNLLNVIIQSISNIDGVFDVYRINSF